MKIDQNLMKNTKTVEEKQKEAATDITVQINGRPPEKLNLQNALEIIQLQTKDIENLKKRITELETIVNSEQHC